MFATSVRVNNVPPDIIHWWIMFPLVNKIPVKLFIYMYTNGSSSYQCVELAEDLKAAVVSIL